MQPDQKRPLKAAKDKSFAWYDSITGVKNELLFSKCTEQKRISEIYSRSSDVKQVKNQEFETNSQSQDDQS